MTVEQRGGAWRVRIRWRGLLALSVPVEDEEAGVELEAALLALKAAKRADLLRWLGEHPDRLGALVIALDRLKPSALTLDDLKEAPTTPEPEAKSVKAMGAEWLEWMKTGTSRRGAPYGKRTREGYERIWKAWLTFEDVATRPADSIRARDITRWGEVLRARGMTASTANRYMMAVQAWSTWLRDEQRGPGLDELPPVRVRQLAENNRVPRAMLPAETQAMRAALDPEWHLLFDLFLLCGMRAIEAQDLRAREIDPGAKTIVLQHVPGDRELKSEKSARAIPVPSSMRRQLERLRKAAPHPGAPVLPERQRSYWAWYNAWRAARVEAKTSARPHDLRHTCAVRLLVDDGLDLASVRDRLGHAAIDTTDRYTQAVDRYRLRTKKK